MPRLKKNVRRGLFFFYDVVGLPLDISINHLKQNFNIDAAQEFLLICEFAADAASAGWTKAKIQSDLREAQMCGGVNVPEMLLK